MPLLRLLIEVDSAQLLPQEVARAMESHEDLHIEMPSWGSAFTGKLVGATEVGSDEPRIRT